MMLTTDLSLRFDPIYEPISRRFYEHPDEFADAFARAWFKLTHRDMGPIARYLGPEVPDEQLIWQDPVPAVDHQLVDEQDIADPQESGSSHQGCPSPSWSRPRGPRHRPSATATSAAGPTGPASASLHRRTGRSMTPRSWRRCSGPSRAIQADFNDSQTGGKKISLADLIVLGGCAAVEQAAKNAGHEVQVPFSPGRTDASHEQTDVDTFAVLEPTADGFRNYVRAGDKRRPEELLIDRASLLGVDRSGDDGAHRRPARPERQHRARPSTASSPIDPETLTNDFFVNLLDMGTEWRVSSAEHVYEGRDRAPGEVKWTGTAVDLVFGSNSQLRAVAEVYATDDAEQKFVQDFAKAWVKVMNLDRFDLR